MCGRQIVPIFRGKKFLFWRSVDQIQRNVFTTCRHKPQIMPEEEENYYEYERDFDQSG